MDQLVEHPKIGTIRYLRSKGRRIGISIKPEFVRVSVPRRQSFKNAQKFVESQIGWIKRKISEMKVRIEKSQVLPVIDREDARKILNQRLAELATEHDFEYGKVSIRKQKTRWGSCSSQNNISLNQSLLHLPDGLIDYILLHELTHTRVKNHSPDFWDELETVCPDAKKKRRLLKTYSHCLV
jgi:predicted metal-dependent hydrolase